LFCEIVPGPKETFEEREEMISISDDAGRGLIVKGDSSGEDYDEDDSHTESDNEEGESDGGDVAYW